MTTEGGTHDYRLSHLHRGEDYEKGAAWTPFDAYMAAREANLLDKLVPRYFPRGVPRYLDFACGTGRITSLLEQRAEESYGIDISPSMLDQARTRCQRTQFFLCDATVEAPPIAPVQLVTSFRFFGHAQDDLRRAALAAIHRLLTPDGYLIINNHCNPWSVHNLLLRTFGRPLPVTSGGGPVNLTPRKLRRFLGEAGFRLVAVHGIGFWIVRASLLSKEVLESRTARLLEPLSRLPLVGSCCPDAVVVARPR